MEVPTKEAAKQCFSMLKPDEAQCDAFKDSFKYYRKLGVEDLRTLAEKPMIPKRDDDWSNKINTKVNDSNCLQKKSYLHNFYGLKPMASWEIHRFEFPAGLIYIRNPFTAEGQRYWISRCVLDFPRTPHVTNIENLRQKTLIPSLPNNQNYSKQVPENSSIFYDKLRWVTFGYHHDWDTKIYSKDRKCDFPQDLALLTQYLSLVLGFTDFRAEAAIVNYYNLDSTLSGHQDRSEINQEAPLFSISFGQSAIFLIGGESKSIAPIPIVLESGDVVVMSGMSRLSYHGVPRIMKATSQPWSSSCSRAVSRNDIDVPDDVTEGHISTKKRKLNDSTCTCEYCIMADHLDSGNFPETHVWSGFLEQYVSKCRINLNIRQVQCL